MADDNRSNVIVFLRRDRAGHELVCAVNFSPEAWEDYRFGVPGGKRYYEEVFNTDSDGMQVVTDIATLRTQLLPRCCCTSHTRLSRPGRSISTAL